MASIPLEAIAVDLDEPIFRVISAWPFEEEFVSRILKEDIPQRVKYESAQIWAYRDPQNTVVGFGSLSLCADYGEFTGGQAHTYIPLLGVHPDERGLGHGTTILMHLVEQARCFIEGVGASAGVGVCNSVFLDVYEDSANAIKLYRKCGFEPLGNCTYPDPQNNKNFYVMARRATS